MAKLSGQFASVYFAATLLLWCAVFLGLLRSASVVGLVLSFAVLLAAVAAAAYSHGSATSVAPTTRESNRATLAIFATLVLIRILLEAVLLGMAGATLGLPALTKWAERWVEQEHYLQLAVTFGLALLAIRVVFPIAAWLGARSTSRGVFS